MTIWLPALQSRPEPKYLAIANAIEEDVRSGRLHPGNRLPPHRELADLLGVTVGTVTRGYAEAEKRGLTHGEVGRGTFVSGDVRSGNFLDLREGIAPGFVDLSLLFPLYPADPDLRASLMEMANRGALQTLLQYQPARGLRDHREAGARWLQRFGLEAPADDILICAGGQHALTVLLGVLSKPGDRILTEELTYPGIKPLANMFHLRLEPVSMDEYGLIPGALAAACAKPGVKGLYTIPSLQNPTAVRLPESRRREIVSICRKEDLWIVEDDCYMPTLDDPPLPLFTFAPERTFFIGSLSKTVAAGLRIAFLVAPKGCTADLEAAITHTLWMVSPVVSELAAMWIRNGTAETILRNKKQEARVRRRIADECLRGFKYRGAPTSYFVWLEIPVPWTPRALQEEALKHQVGLVSTEQFAVGHASVPNFIRVSLSAPLTREALAKGLTVVAGLLSRDPRPHEAVF